MRGFRSLAGRMRRWYVGTVYADHNRSRSVRVALGDEIALAGQRSGRGLNVGSGGSVLGPRILNLDIVAGANVGVVASATDLPFPDECFDLVISQETLEHVSDPFQAMAEISRVLVSEGRLFLQLPFTIGYHPGPTDFWRFSVEGITELVDRVGLEVVRIGSTVGGASGFYRIAVEFFAALVSLPWPSMVYIPAKAFFSLLLFPIKWLDPAFKLHPERHRICGGYFVVASKPVEARADISVRRV